MGDVKSKNLYELLGNDHDQDSDKEPEPPTKAVDKTAPRIGKRDVAKEAPGAAAGGAGGQRRDGEQRTGGFNQENRRFRDRTNNSKNPNPTENRNRDLDTRGAEGVPGRDSGPGARRARGGPRRGGDRHSRTGRGDHAKQVDQGWGGQTGEAEESIEKAGEADAQQDKKEEITENAGIPEEPIPEPEPEPEDTSVSYTDYLKQQAEKKMADLGLKEARKPNEGAKENKTWATKEVSSDKQGESYFEGQQKASRQRERETKKQVLDIDYSFKEPQRESGTRGGRGDRGSRGDRRGGRGDRGEGRGEYRGGRGRGDFQSRGDRGDRVPRGDRGSYRGGRGGQSNQNDQPAISDSSAFPALGGN